MYISISGAQIESSRAFLFLPPWWGKVRMAGSHGFVSALRPLILSLSRKGRRDRYLQGSKDAVRWNWSFTSALIMTIIGLGLEGCATVNPQPRWQQVAALAAQRTDAPVLWEQTEADASTIANQVDGLLADGLTQQDAVRIALLNNRQLQAAFEEIGIAEADVVQAGLFTNPSLDTFLGFPFSLGDSGGGALGFVSDLWTTPARKEVFARQAEVTLQQVGVEVTATATEAMMAYDEVLYRTAVVELEQALLKIRSDTAAHMQIRYDHGFESDLELYHSQVAVAEQQVAVANARQELTMAQTWLRKVLSLTDGQYQLTDTLEMVPEDNWSEGTAVPFALAHRLDLAQTRLAVEQAERQAAFARTQVFRLVGVGTGYEGDFGAENSKGPTLSVELPLFDHNQAQIAKAEYRIRQTKKELAARELHARKEVTDALAARNFHRQDLARLRAEIQPAVAKEVEYAEYWSTRMQVDFLKLLETRERELASRHRYLDALWQLREADVRLYRALWGGSEFSSKEGKN